MRSTATKDTSVSHEIVTPMIRAIPSDAALQGVVLPPIPTTLARLDHERAKPEPNLREIAQIIERDLSVAAAVMKTVNSPLFGFRRSIDSIPQAVFLLGLENVSNLVTALSLRDSMRGAAFPPMDRFLDSAQDVACIMSAVAEELTLMSPAQAYLLGLFHDCGIPLLLQRFSSYKEVLRIANRTPNRPIITVEDEHLRTDHTQVGYLVSKSWKLPQATCLAILYHHHVSELLAAAQTQRESDGYITDLINAVALVTMAEAISYRFRRRQESHDWDCVGGAILARFGLTEQAFETLTQAMIEKLTA